MFVGATNPNRARTAIAASRRTPACFFASGHTGSCEVSGQTALAGRTTGQGANQAVMGGSR